MSIAEIEICCKFHHFNYATKFPHGKRKTRKVWGFQAFFLESLGNRSLRSVVSIDIKCKLFNALQTIFVKPRTSRIFS